MSEALWSRHKDVEVGRKFHTIRRDTKYNDDLIFDLITSHCLWLIPPSVHAPGLIEKPHHCTSTKQGIESRSRNPHA